MILVKEMPLERLNFEQIEILLQEGENISNAIKRSNRNNKMVCDDLWEDLIISHLSEGHYN